MFPNLIPIAPSRRRWTRGIALACLALVATSCGEAEPPVGRLEAELSQAELSYPGLATLSLSFQMDKELGEVDGDLLLFVHLLQGPGNPVRTFDHVFPVPWRPGGSHQYEVKLYQSALASPLEPGAYELSVGLYDASGRRWPLEVAGNGIEVDRNEYQVAVVNATAESEDGPMFYFSSTWMPIESGTDRQILGRRWLAGEGSIRVAEIPSEGALWLLLRIPPPQSGVEELVLEQGADQPTLLLSSTCGEVQSSVSGLGVHEAVFPVTADDEGELPEECEISFLPNFHILKLDTLARWSVALEVLAWSK